MESNLTQSSEQSSIDEKTPKKKGGLFKRFYNVYLKMSIGNKILLGYAIPLLLMIFVSLMVYKSTIHLIETDKWVEHTQEVISKGQLLGKLIVEMETGERGFLITGKENFLEPLHQAKTKW